MAEVAPYPGVFAALDPLADVITLDADERVFADRLPEFDGYIASLRVRATREVLETAPRLRFIATPSTGLDHIDLACARDRGIAVLSLKDDTEFLSTVTATAEMAWALLLAVVRRLPWSFEAARQGRWARDEFRGHQLSGRTLGILGYGRLGRIVGEYGVAFRMRVIAHDVAPVAPGPGVTMVDADTLFRESDVLSVHIHLTEENRGFVSAARLARMKPGAVLVNTSRGGVVDERALVRALESGALGGAGLDVIEGEWSPDLRSHPLVRYANARQNLVISPHTGGVTFESQRMTLEFLAGKIASHLQATGA